MKRPHPSKLQRFATAATLTATLVLAASAPAFAQPTAEPPAGLDEPTAPDLPPSRGWKLVGGSLVGGGMAVGTLGGFLFFRDTRMEPGQLWMRLAMFAGGVGAAFTGGWMLAFAPTEGAAPRAALLVRTLRF